MADYVKIPVDTLDNFCMTAFKKLGFKKSDRSFGSLNDGREALFFNAGKMFPRADGTLPNNGKDEWFVTTESLNEIND